MKKKTKNLFFNGMNFSGRTEGKVETFSVLKRIGVPEQEAELVSVVLMWERAMMN